MTERIERCRPRRVLASVNIYDDGDFDLTIRNMKGKDEEQLINRLRTFLCECWEDDKSVNREVIK